MDDFQIFRFGSHDVRVVIENGILWWVAKDVCDALEISDARQAVSRLEEDERCLIPVADSMGRMQETFCTNEPGLYSLALGSRKPQAKPFKRWITHEVIPTIRRTGGYVSNDELFVSTYLQHADEQTKTMFRATLETVRKQNEKIAVMEPKADFYDTVASSADAIDIGTAAKVLKIPGIGRNNLFERLRREKILMPNNLPYQEYIDRGYFRVIEQTYTPPGGVPKVKPKTLVYQKGLDYIRKKLERG